MRGLDDEATELAGVTPDGGAYFTRMAYEWRLVELDRGGARVERGAGSQRTELNGSPDGEWVAWIEDGDGGRQLRVAPVDRMAERPAPIAAGVMTVAWNPDGRSLAAILQTGSRHELVVMDLSGSVLRRVPVSDVDAEDWMAWLGKDAVVVTSADNRRMLRVGLTDGAVESLLHEPGDVADPQTRADGSILFAWDHDARGKAGVWLRAGDGQLTMLREDDDSSVHAAWLPGGEAVLLYDRESGHVWRLPRMDGDPVRAPPVPLAGNEWMPALWPRGPDRMLAHVVRRTTDLHVSRPQ
jgi:SdiA-regulated